ncbi:DUF1304 family protein [Helicobacter saguini]|uniref:DUF1304 domain-containing protein n=1 Tax=Helicobacter saguini TaxID=1548018 RepID=A0A347VPD3_9HELI|nr:DUF1304 domain-containing protein [Helicobacter saguini]MWV61410.1 DUF1304 family protein [Helicobacter saguini]MWV67920.1 DUF1304 family protein [Helicobacter saguini]MWV70612.1 DUF1304 family protein [Helicobacter saguini]MWV72517.1 DUF1304 family protein [Helicobacter saguini]TLD94741.1 DUF1304 domain-containing protein [Helicobacter saguini]
MSFGLLANIFGTLCVLEFFYILYLETFATSSHATSRVFKIPQEKLSEKNLNILFKNQGVYNGLLGVWLLYGIYMSDNSFEITFGALIFIIIVALVGAITSDKMILLKQGGLAILALICLLADKFL